MLTTILTVLAIIVLGPLAIWMIAVVLVLIVAGLLSILFS